jgi:phosphoribulokinase
VHGLHPLYTEKLRSLARVRIYLDPEAALLQQWKIMRDSTMWAMFNARAIPWRLPS